MPDTEALKKNWEYIHSQILAKNIVSAFAVGTNGVAEGLCKMCFGNGFGVDVQVDENDLFAVAPGSIVVESIDPLDYAGAIKLGTVTSGDPGTFKINSHKFDVFELLQANEGRWASVYPIDSQPDMNKIKFHAINHGSYKPTYKYTGKIDGKPLVYLPVFPGTNCDYDTAKAFRSAGAQTRFGVFCNLTEEDIFRSLEEMERNLSECQILALCGGFSAGDEPDGSGKFIANILRNKRISAKIQELLDRGGLILGICNGFQALVKSGLLPYGNTESITVDSPTLFRNDINRHVATMITTQVSSTNSPWLAGMKVGDQHCIPVSHGEGKFVVSEKLAKELFDNQQVAFQYIDPYTDEPTMQYPYNPNGSYYAIEGIISKNGQILGKMGHTERYENNLFKNRQENFDQPIFENAVKYFNLK